MRRSSSSGREKISPALEHLRVPVESVTPWPDNPRQGDVGAIAESLRRFGQTKPIVVEASGRRIVAGNHVWAAARALGWSEIAANVLEMDEATAKAYLVADNRTAELGTYDDQALGRLLREIAEAGDLRGTGYDGDDVDELLKKIEREHAERVEPEIPFETELLESHNYLVMYFDNELDWNAARSVFGVRTVKTRDSTDTYLRKGIGRVISGAKVLAMLEGRTS